MSRKASEKPIGIFDSGVGGISVLAEMIKQLPGEKFIYFADSKNAPYGTKDKKTVSKLSIDAANFLLRKDIKALVVACNTATAVAINDLRAELKMPVIGMEPALKPAIELGREGKILVMATPVTLRQEKFNVLLHRCDERSRVIPLPCAGLVELVESGNTEGVKVEEFLKRLFEEVRSEPVEVVVLGCTHYVFLREEIKKFFPEIPIIDGNCGTAKQLKNVLAEYGCRNIMKPDSSPNCSKDGVEVEFYTSGEPSHVVPLCRNLLEKILK